MDWVPARQAVQRLWGRRWVRRVSYTLVAGASVATLLRWAADRPALHRWALARLDGYVREETGLSLSIGRLELHPLQGELILHDLRLGGDLLTIQRAVAQVDTWSLLGPSPRIRSLRVDQPHLRLTEAGLAGLRMKPHPPRSGPLPQVRLDTFILTGGEVVVPTAFRGLPELTYHFEAKGRGLGPNHLRLEWRGPHLDVRSPGGWEKGRLDVIADLAEPRLEVHEAYARLGETQVRLSGAFEARQEAGMGRLEGKATGLLDLAQAARWARWTSPPLHGALDLTATLQGTLARPAWTLQADGQDLRPATATFQPGQLSLKASGGVDRARLEFLRWASPQGDLDLGLTWHLRAPLDATLSARNLDLSALGQLLRVPSLAGVRGTVDLAATGPAGSTDLARLDRWKGTLRMGFTQDAAPAGGLEADLTQGQARLTRLDLKLAEVSLGGRAAATLGPQGLRGFTGEGTATLDAALVARCLQSWQVVDLDMAGAAQAQGQVRWTPSRSGGLQVDGTLRVAQPRWHGARADELQAGAIALRGSELRIRDIQVTKGEGRGGGELWLTWGPTAPGQPQLDMCYTAFRLPVAEGLRAADVRDPEGQELPIQGTASGWARLVGPFDRLILTGAAQAESNQVYGITLPAVCGDFWMDLSRGHLRVSDLRVAERPALLGHGDLPPDGSLALQGHADLDLDRWTGWVELGGRLDTQSLALPGPRIQAQLDARLLGPLTAPFGALDLPEGDLRLSRARLFFGERSLEGLQGQLSLHRGRLAASLGMEGMARSLVDLQVHQQGPDLVGHADLNLAPESVQTGPLAQRLTSDLLEDLRLSAALDGRWAQGRELSWTGTLHQLAAQFSAFELHQTGPSALHGTAEGASVDVALEGGARGADASARPQAAQLRLSGALPFSAAAPLGLQLRGSADLAHLKTILDRLMEVDEYSLLSELTVGGTSRFDLLAHGTFPEPLLDGVVSLDRGKLSLRGYQGAEDLRAEIHLKDRTLTVDAEQPVQGTLAHGDLRASGSATWQPGGLDSYAFQATLSGFQLRDVPEGLDLQGSLRATLKGDDEGGVLKGTLQADRLSYQSEVKLADLILRSALSDSGGLTGLDLDDPLERIRLDLDLDLRTPWSFDTNLLKLEGRTAGPFQVVGTLGHPVPKGTMLFQPGGRVTNIFPAGDMVVDQGSLTFSETRPLDPLIALQGSVSSIPGYTVNLDIRGTLSNLTVLPSSTPSLRQDEIVAILINPGNVANVGTAGASSGATQGAITSGLAGAGSGLITTLAFAPFQEQLRRAFGLDRVNVAVRSTFGGTETEVTLGKSINLLGQRSAFVVSHKKSGELSITSGQVEWRFGNLILQLGASKGGSSGLNPSGEIRHTWSPR